MTECPPPLTAIPRDVVAVHDYEPYARARLDERAWAYLTGGAADGLTLRWNREAFDSVKLCGRVLADCAGGNTRTEVLGQPLAHPILLAPVAYQRLFHPDGERATAMAAGAMDTPMVVSALASTRLEDIAASARGALWFQLYMQGDRGLTRSLVERAAAANYRAVVLTVDAPINGVRNAEQRAGFSLPAGISAVNLPEAGPGRQFSSEAHPIFDVLMSGAPTWRDVEWLVAHSPLPVVLKGIQTPADALRCVEVGAAGLVVSNHGGRTLDTLAPTIELLPPIADRVGDRLTVMLDGGVRRGTDVLKALALGARAVLIGRAYAQALAAAGPLGVAHVIRLLVEEFAVAMALTGCRTVDQIGPEVLHRG